MVARRLGLINTDSDSARASDDIQGISPTIILQQQWIELNTMPAETRPRRDRAVQPRYANADAEVSETRTVFRFPVVVIAPATTRTKPADCDFAQLRAIRNRERRKEGNFVRSCIQQAAIIRQINFPTIQESSSWLKNDGTTPGHIKPTKTFSLGHATIIRSSGSYHFPERAT